MGTKLIDTKEIYKIIYKLAKDANINLPLCVFEKIKNCNSDEDIKNEILQNAYLAKTKSRPLCQDCGQVVVFIEIGQNIKLEGDYIEDVINKAISDCYTENYFRKSVVIDAINNRDNTKNNTPAIIHTKIIKEDEINILLALKGGGAENTCQIKMFNPTASKEEIFDFIRETAKNAIKFACPPISIGVGIGGVLETSCELAKKALFEGEDVDINLKDVFEAKMLTTSTHIANLPVCVNINCHSSRFKKAHINFDNQNYKITFEEDNFTPKKIDLNKEYKKINTNNLEDFKELKIGEKILLSGTIYTARDMAHKRLVDLIKKEEKLPINLKDIFIFYAGPAPKKDNEVIGPVGPTTSKRMDNYAKILYDNGVFATIGKGDRQEDLKPYLTATGGVACLLQDCILKSEVVAFEDLGAEAIYKLEIKDMPLTVKNI
ncbi:MAG: hypothetical protein E7Z91_01870 [Cyanobacteria bacterium SIG30]|nr:hypothetical protein [Cyanobacteria bacterium SIG30]